MPDLDIATLDEWLTPEKYKGDDDLSWMKPFLIALAETGNVTKAAKKAGLNSRTLVYHYLDKFPGFRIAFDRAREIAVGLLEDEAWRRAHDGVLEPVYYKGEKQGTVRKYSDTLLIFLLKANNPAKYRENIDITSGGQPIKGYVGFTPDEWDSDASTE